MGCSWVWAWVFWHPEPEQLTERFRKPSGAVGHHFIVEDKTACDLPGQGREVRCVSGAVRTLLRTPHAPHPRLARIVVFF
jgi:hypothetical protein